MCSTRSNAFEASKNTACTDEPWVTKYEAVCFNENLSVGVVLNDVPRTGSALNRCCSLLPHCGDSSTYHWKFPIAIGLNPKTTNKNVTS